MNPLEKIAPERIAMHSDHRGHLWKILAASALPEKAPFGEIYLITIQPGEVRGEHYHRETTEWFIPVFGQIECRLALPDSPHLKTVLLDGREPALLKVPPRIAHSLTNVGASEAMVLAYADEEYCHGNPDRVSYRI